ncbi:MAG TPA: hypothetical protein VM347_05615 [Nonomuraea sp.]|nr:hypothetical protein [Nonomuraea sp.]
MTVGLHTANLANKWLDMLRAVAFTAPASLNTKLHTADPGAAGTTAPSANTTRVVTTHSAAAAGAIALSNTPTWATWAAGSETISHITEWDNITAGVVLLSAALTTPKAVANGDTLTLTSLGISLAPLMA